MIKNFLVVFVSFLITGFIFLTSSFAQSTNTEIQIKKITNANYNCRSPQFYWRNLNHSAHPDELFFVAQHDSVSNIYILRCNSATDSFYTPLPLTNNNFKNINPVGALYNGSSEKDRFILWQTNQNGNWDIAYASNLSNYWSLTSLLLNSAYNETNPSLIRNYDVDSLSNLKFLYLKNNSVYLYSNNNGIPSSEIIFQGNDTVVFSSPTGKIAYYSGVNNLFIAAVKRINSNISVLVERHKTYPSGNWTNERVIYDSGYVSNSNFADLSFTFWNSAGLSFESLINGKNNVYIFEELSHFGYNYLAKKVFDDNSIQTSSLSMAAISIIVDFNSYDIYGPRTYKAIKNYNNYVAVNKYLVPGLSTTTGDSLIYLKYPYSQNTIGIPGAFTPSPGVISYSIWEDSSNGYLNLFAVKRIDPISGIKEGNSVDNFTLLQNYPNPFNPITRIQYSVAGYQNVNLSVYDVLGRNIATLVNEQKQPGSYFVDFNANNLASGIYFYSIKANNLIKTRKMIVIK